MIELNQKFTGLKEELAGWEELEKEVKDFEDLVALEEDVSLDEIVKKIEKKERYGI